MPIVDVMFATVWESSWCRLTREGVTRICRVGGMYGMLLLVRSLDALCDAMRLIEALSQAWRTRQANTGHGAPRRIPAPGGPFGFGF